MKINLINTKELIKGLLIICLYFIAPVLLSSPFLFLIKKHIISYPIATILLYLSLTILFSIIYIKDLIKDFKDFKKNYKSILKVSFTYWIKGLFIMLTSSYIIGLLKIAPNVNQQENINILKQMPLVEFICAIFLAPIFEELVFRRGLKNFTRNKHIYALTTGIIFAFIHVISSLSTIDSYIMLIYLIPYSALGIAFGYTYQKTNNIYSTIIPHAIHNAISLLEILILGALL